MDFEESDEHAAPGRVSHPLATAKIETELAALMTRRAAWLHDRELPAGEAGPGE